MVGNDRGVCVSSTIIVQEKGRYPIAGQMLEETGQGQPPCGSTDRPTFYHCYKSLPMSSTQTLNLSMCLFLLFLVYLYSSNLSITVSVPIY